MNIHSIQRILYVQYAPFGDVLCNTGVLPYVRRAFPQAQLHYLAQHPFHQVLAQNPNLDEVVVFHKDTGLRSSGQRVKLFWEIRRRRYDLIIDQMCGALSAQITLFSGAPHRLGYADSRRRMVYNIRAPRKEQRYTAASKFDLLAPLGIAEGPYQLEYVIAPEAEAAVERWLATEGLAPERLICVAPGSKRAHKIWNPACFAQVCDAVQTTTPYTILLMGTKDEQKTIQAVVAAMTTKPVIAPQFTLNEAVALLKRARLLICNDAALNHFSAVTRTPSLALFGRTKPINWSPTTDPHHYYLHHPERYRAGDDSFGISPEEAVAKVSEILRTLYGHAG